MKIGFDIDGVLANFIDQFLVEYVNPKTERGFVPEDMSDFSIHQSFGISKEDEAEWFNHARDHEIFTRLRPYDGMINGVRQLIKDGHEVYYITHRSKRAIEQTYKWFMRYNIPFGQGIFYTPMDRTPTKGEMAQYLGLDVFIDDCYENCLELRGKVKTVLVMDRPWNKKYRHHDERHGFNRVYSIDDIISGVRTWEPPKTSDD